MFGALTDINNCIDTYNGRLKRIDSIVSVDRAIYHRYSKKTIVRYAISYALYISEVVTILSDTFFVDPYTK